MASREGGGWPGGRDRPLTKSAFSGSDEGVILRALAGC